MTKLQIIFYCILIPVIVSVFLSVLKDSSVQSNERIVHMPIFSKWLGIALGILGFGLFVVSMRRMVSNRVIVIGVSLCALSLLFFAMFFSLRICYDAHGFYVRRFFRKRFYQYEDLKAISFGAGSQYTLYLKKGRIFVDNFAVGGESFLNYAQLQWIYATGKDNLPLRNTRLFNGYLLNPVEILIGLVIAPVFATVALLFIMMHEISTFPPPLETAELYVDYTIYTDDAVLLVCGDNTMEVNRLYLQDETVLTTAIEQKLPLSVSYEQPSSPEKPSRVWGISRGDSICVSVASVLQAKRSSMLRAYLIGWGVVFIFWIWVAGLYYVFSHAPRYKRLLPLLVRREFWNF